MISLNHDFEVHLIWKHDGKQ